MSQDYKWNYLVVGDNFRGENTVASGWGNNQSSKASDSIGGADILQVCISKTSKILSKKTSQEQGGKFPGNLGTRFPRNA